jgi:hypothetical protein
VAAMRRRKYARSAADAEVFRLPGIPV